LNKALRHFELFEFVAGIDHDAIRPMFGKQLPHEDLAKRASSTGYENGRAIK
jgi:hypothetical protein